MFSYRDQFEMLVGKLVKDREDMVAREQAHQKVSITTVAVFVKALHILLLNRNYHGRGLKKGLR